MVVLKQFSGAGTYPFNVKIYTPDNTTGTLPAFIFFTGRGESGMDATLIDRNGPFYFITNKAWKPPFIVIGVQINQNQAPGPLPLVQAALDSLADPQYRVDWTKWYLTGLSYGAATLIGYIQEQTDTLFKKPAAVMPMSINMTPKGGSRFDAVYTLAGTDLRFKNIPAWGFCGASDGFFETMSRYWAALAKAGYIAPWTTLNEGHGPWNQWYDPAYKDVVSGMSIYQWALQYNTISVVVPPVVIPPVTPPVVEMFHISLKSGAAFYYYSDTSGIIK